MLSTDPISFWLFFSEAFVPFQRLELPLKPFHKELCDTLQAVALGLRKEPFIIINIPPRFGKTKILEALVCWQLGIFPDSNIIYSCYSSDLAERTMIYIESVIKSEWYRTMTGDILGDVCQAGKFFTKDGGAVMAAGTGGTITGTGAGLKRPAGGFIIIDDAIKPDEALSKTVEKHINFWFTNTLLSRRNSPHTPVIVCGQRLSRNDICGHVLKTYAGDVIHLKAPAYKNGKSIYPETISTAALEKMRVADPFTFASQYQQEPVALGGNIIKTDDFRFYSDTPDSIKWDFKTIVADTAQKTKEHNDFTVMQCWGALGGKAYLIDQLRGKFEAPDLEKMAIGFWHAHYGPGMRVFRIEDKVSGTGLIQQLIRRGIPVMPIERIRDKYTRLLDILPFIRTGQVYLPQNAPWLDDFITECAEFSPEMNHAHDDQVDCLIDGLNEILSQSNVSILDVL
jgi:predicted phage terminase large subunit-like protein